MTGDHFLYFAYGSNMLTARIQERCPSAQPLGIAELPGFDLRWHKRSKDDSGKCDIVNTGEPAASVFGVLYQIASDEKGALDKAEGLGSGYDEAEISVRRGPDQVTAKTYVATRTDPALKPYTWYHAFVVAGAQQHSLPADYIASLEAVPATEDPDRARHDRYSRLLAEALA
jgi:cation transport regulator ChaC